MPFTTPNVLMVPAAGLVELQVPPIAVLLSVTAAPAQTEPAPEIAPAFAPLFTVTTVVA